MKTRRKRIMKKTPRKIKPFFHFILTDPGLFVPENLFGIFRPYLIPDPVQGLGLGLARRREFPFKVRKFYFQFYGLFYLLLFLFIFVVLIVFIIYLMCHFFYLLFFFIFMFRFPTCYRGVLSTSFSVSFLCHRSH